LRAVILSEDFVIHRLTTDHENALSPLGERVARDRAFISRRGSGKGVRFRYFHGSEESAVVCFQEGITDASLRFA
jgi:hypothetical protein